MVTCQDSTVLHTERVFTDHRLEVHKLDEHMDLKLKVHGDLTLKVHKLEARMD